MKWIDKENLTEVKSSSSIYLKQKIWPYSKGEKRLLNEGGLIVKRKVPKLVHVSKLSMVL